MTTDEIRALVRRCEALGRCPLGAARPKWDQPTPLPSTTVAIDLGVTIVEADRIADEWDGWTTGRPAHVRSMRRAIAAGLGPRIVAGLERLEGAQ